MNGELIFDNNDAEQFKDWYQLYYPMVRNLVIQNGGLKEDAEEVFQETFIIYFEKIKNRDFVLTSKPSTYIYSVALNKWREALRKKGSRIENIINSEFGDDLYVEDGEYDYEKDLQILNLQRCIEDLPGKQRKVVLSYFYLKKSMKEIAKDIGFENDNSAKSQNWKAVQNLKKCMELKKS